ncbi:MAG: hypothetical protein KBD01_20245, partial [Acidobacteria bacterium]|nr:hypothetical protein [Acidobacteriota bacterium]
VPYDQWGNRARRPSRELTTCAQPRIDAIEAEGGVFSRVTLRGANFQPGARILPRRAGLFVDAASVTGTGAIVANLRLAPGVVPEPADFLVVNPVRRAADFLKAHRELADVDGSGLVDEADAAAVALRFGTAAKTRDLQVFDMNGDGMIDGEDAAAVRDHIGK